MTAETQFLADPVGFMRSNIIVVRYGGDKVKARTTPVRQFQLTHDPNIAAKKNHFHWYNTSVPVYIASEHPTGTIGAYVLGYEDSASVGTILGNQPTDPGIMFTVTMNSCTLGFAQDSAHHACYVSHHNARLQDNDDGVMEGQLPDFGDGTNPALTYAHRGTYMSDSKNALNMRYSSTTIGVRDNTGIWRFYMQSKKYHGNNKNKNFSLKGVIEVNP